VESKETVMMDLLSYPNNMEFSYRDQEGRTIYFDLNDYFPSHFSTGMGSDKYDRITEYANRKIAAYNKGLDKFLWPSIINIRLYVPCTGYFVGKDFEEKTPLIEYITSERDRVYEDIKNYADSLSDGMAQSEEDDLKDFAMKESEETTHKYVPTTTMHNGMLLRGFAAEKQ
jgi:hypothetical protein